MILFYYSMIETKRYFLPLFFVISVLMIEEIRDFVYMPFVVTPCFFVLFWNFPAIVYYANSKPTYYEDLFIDEKKIPNYDVSIEIKNKYQKIYKWALISSTSLLTGALSDYWLYKTAELKTPFEIAGVSGGIIALFRNMNDTVGKIIIYFVSKQIIKESNQNIKMKEWNKLETPEHLRSATPPPINHHIEIVRLRERADTI